MCSREALRPTLLGSRQPKGQSSCATAIGFLLPPASSASCREGLVHGVVKHLALIRARMGVVVLTSYHSSRAGCVRVVHRSLAATSPGLCLQGCVAQGAPCKGVRRRAARKVRSGRSVRRQRRSAPCAWHAAVVLPRIRAQPRAEMMGVHSWVPPHSPAQAAACGARGAQRREPDAMEQYAREQYALRTRSPQLLRGAVWWRGSGQRTERGEERCAPSARSVIAFGYVGFSTLYLTPRPPRG